MMGYILGLFYCHLDLALHPRVLGYLLITFVKPGKQAGKYNALQAA